MVIFFVYNNDIFDIFNIDNIFGEKEVVLEMIDEIEVMVDDKEVVKIVEEDKFDVILLDEDFVVVEFKELVFFI